jgi:hypothetical protein
VNACERAFKLGAIPFLNHLKTTYDVDLAVEDDKSTIRNFLKVFSPDKNADKEEHTKLLYKEITIKLLEIF